MVKFFFIFILLFHVTFAQSIAQKPDATAPKQPTTAKEVDKLKSQEPAYALPWEAIPERNILWKVRVLRTIDATAKDNKPFVYNAVLPDDYNLANILLQGVFNKQYKAYSGANDQFATELTQQDIMGFFAPGNKNAVSDFKPSNVTRYLVKEDLLYLAAEKKIVVRILGIAPLYNVTMEDGRTTEQPLLWLYYPDIRKFLAEHPVYSGKTALDMNWDQLFEGRNFSSRIDKVMGTKKMQ